MIQRLSFRRQAEDRRRGVRKPLQTDPSLVTELHGGRGVEGHPAGFVALRGLDQKPGRLLVVLDLAQAQPQRLPDPNPPTRPRYSKRVTRGKVET